MQDYRATGLAVLILTASLSSAWADVASGPVVGEGVPALKVLVVVGEKAGDELDLAAGRKEHPTVYVFLQADKFDRPMARYLRALDESVTKAGQNTAIVVVWLTGTPDATKEYLPKVQMSLKLQSTTYAQHANTAGPEGWGINPDAHLTAVVAGKAKVAANFGYRSLNDTVVPEVDAALKKLADSQ